MEAIIEQVTYQQFQTLVLDNWLKRGEVRMKVLSENVIRFNDLQGVPWAECYVGIDNRDDVYYIIH